METLKKMVLRMVENLNKRIAGFRSDRLESVIADNPIYIISTFLANNANFFVTSTITKFL